METKDELIASITSLEEEYLETRSGLDMIGIKTKLYDAKTQLKRLLEQQQEEIELEMQQTLRNLEEI